MWAMFQLSWHSTGHQWLKVNMLWDATGPSFLVRLDLNLCNTCSSPLFNPAVPSPEQRGLHTRRHTPQSGQLLASSTHSIRWGGRGRRGADARRCLELPATAVFRLQFRGCAQRMVLRCGSTCRWVTATAFTLAATPPVA